MKGDIVKERRKTKKVGESMAFNILLFTVLMIGTIVLSFIVSREQTVDTRKEQSKNLFRENVVKKQLESYSTQKVTYSKRYKVETLCLQAGLKITYVEYLMVKLVTGALFALFGVFVMNNPLLAVIFAVIGFILPKEIITLLKNRRVQIMEKQIGPFMQMVIKRYEATKDFSKSLELTMKEFEGEQPLYGEIKQTVLDVKVGTPVAEAMEGMGRRTGNIYLVRLADYYKIASSLGTDSIRKKLLTQAYQQFEENREVKLKMKKELSGPVRNAYISLGMVPAIAIYQTMTNDSYVDFMINTFIGKVGTAVIMSVLVGALWFINAKIGAPLEE